MERDSVVLTVRVRCCGQKHRILLMRSGALSFPDHSKGFVAERVLARFADKPCRCLAILCAWRGWQAGWLGYELEDLPAALVTQAVLTKGRGVERRQFRFQAIDGDPLQRTTLHRIMCQLR